MENKNELFKIEEVVIGSGGESRIQISDEEYDLFVNLIHSFKEENSVFKQMPLLRLIRRILSKEVYEKVSEAMLNQKEIIFINGDTERKSLGDIFEEEKK